MKLKNTKFFKDIDFELLAKRNFPQIPYVPVVSHAGDTSNFDLCDEEEKATKNPPVESYGDAFRDF